MNRDERAFFDHVYRTVFPTLYRVVARIVDPESAEEVCHEAFLRFYDHSDRLPDAEQAKFWLLRVGKNLAFNVARRKGRERTAMERVFREPRRAEPAADEAVLRSETEVVVRNALEQLPKSLREVIILKEYGDLGYAEIAATLGITVGNVKVRVHRARERLATLLEVDDVHLRS